MQGMIRAAENGYIPDALIRVGIRRLIKRRLAGESRQSSEKLVEQLRNQPVAVEQAQANEQHYEVPPELFELMLGPRLKYSSCHWSSPGQSLAEAEDEMLALTCRRAGLRDGMSLLDLGCGWGSLTLSAAERFPGCDVTALSNSHAQAEFIRARAESLGLSNVRVLTDDVERFASERRYDRIVSIEMFEHMRNYELLLRRIAGWLEQDGKLFVHLFCHHTLAYLFEDNGGDDWMARHFFTGGTMPSLDLLGRFDRDLRVADQWTVSGKQYERTLLAWLDKLDGQRHEAIEILERHHTPREARVQLMRWRLFLLSCAELFGFAEGREWMVAHYLMERS
jgi:cyclopropane-fatty-acyl-phospholipid synthase